MNNPNAIFRAASNALRSSPGYGALSSAERRRLDRDMGRIGDVLAGRGVHAYGQSRGEDPYSMPMETPNDLRGVGAFPGGGAQPANPAGQNGASVPPSKPAGGPAARPSNTEVLGERARRALDAVDFPSFVAQLIQGTFQAIVDATSQQVRDYAGLVADLSKSLDDFTRDNVSDNQARDYLVGKHGGDLQMVLPAPGEQAEPQVVPREGGDENPAWLAEYGLEGETLSEELVEGELLGAGRRILAEQRMQTLATMVLMGINRIVVNDGELKAKLQFHAKARESTTAAVVAQSGGQQLGIAARQSGMQSAVSTMVSTVDVNAQSDISIKTDLVGEVAVRFRTETFDINRFADSQAIALINRHALTRNNEGAGDGSKPQGEGGGGG